MPSIIKSVGICNAVAEIKIWSCRNCNAVKIISLSSLKMMKTQCCNILVQLKLVPAQPRVLILAVSILVSSPCLVLFTWPGNPMWWSRDATRLGGSCKLDGYSQVKSVPSMVLTLPSLALCVLHLIPYADIAHLVLLLTHCCWVLPYGNKELGQH